MGSRPHRTGDGLDPAADQGLPPRRGARPRRLPAGRRAGGVEPLRRAVRHGRPRVRDRLLREVRLRPAGLHAQPRHHLHRADGRLLQEDRLHPRQPRERRRGAALGWRGRRLPRRRLRRLPTDDLGEQDRLRRPHRLRAGGAERRCADRAVGVDRRAASTVVPVPRRVAGQGGAAGQAHAGQDPAHLVRLSVRLVGGASGQRAAADQDRHAGAGTDRHRRAVRRGPRRRRGRRPRPARHAARTRRIGKGTPHSRAGLSVGLTDIPRRFARPATDIPPSLRSPRRWYPLLRAVAELTNASNAVQPLGRKGYVTMPVFAFGWPTGEAAPVVAGLSMLDAARRGLRGDFRGRRGRIALAITALSWGVLGFVYRRAAQSQPRFEDPLRETLGENYEAVVAQERRRRPGGVLRTSWSRRQYVQKTSTVGASGATGNVIRYGPHRVNVADVWRRADLPRDRRAPVLLQVPGGAWA